MNDTTELPAAYVARRHLDVRAPTPSLFHARSLAELAEWATANGMMVGPVSKGTNHYAPEHVDGSTLSAAEFDRLPHLGAVLAEATNGRPAARLRDEGWREGWPPVVWRGRG